MEEAPVSEKSQEGLTFLGYYARGDIPVAVFQDASHAFCVNRASLAEKVAFLQRHNRPCDCSERTLVAWPDQVLPMPDDVFQKIISGIRPPLSHRAEREPRPCPRPK